MSLYKRKYTLFALSCTALSAFSATKGSVEHPNIILLMADQFRSDCVGAMGNPYISTPNLDRLANDGVLFTKGYSSVPSSTPARAGLLTGCSPWVHGMLGYGRQAVHYPYEMPRMLHDAGYYAFGIGKMHYYPPRNKHGFDGTLVDEEGRVGYAGFVSDYHEWFAIQAPGMNPDSTGINWNGHDGKQFVYDERLHPTAWTGSEALQFLKNYNQQKPLFLKVSFARPHSPYDPPKRFVDMYRNKPVKERVVGDWCARFANYPNTPDAAYGDFGKDNADQSRRYYYGSVSFIDDQIGKIIHLLKQKGMYENSVIIFVADHGDMLGDHYHWRKTYAYEGSSHIPYIIKLPAAYGHKHQKVDQVVELRDILPTLLQIDHLQQPKGMDGMSLLPLVDNANASWRPYLDMEHATCYSDDNYWSGLTDGKMKYIWFFHTGEEQLFDMQKDPNELHDVSKDKAYAPELAKWRDRMLKHLSERGEPYVKDGKLNVFKQTILYSPNYPKNNDIAPAKDY